MSTHFRIALLLTAIILPVFNASSLPARTSEEQLHFSAEDNSVKRPVAIPAEVLSILKKDDFVLQNLENENLSANKFPTSWFVASEVHLGNAVEKDLVLMGVGPLRGANINTFWVFMQNSDGWKLVLRPPVHDLVIQQRRWKGHRNITTLSATANKSWQTYFRFNGREYKFYLTKNLRR